MANADEEFVTPPASEADATWQPEHASHGTGQHVVDEVSKDKLPQFWKSRPALWLTQTDAQFHHHRVISDTSKYYAVIAVLELDILEEVANVI